MFAIFYGLELVYFECNHFILSTPLLHIHTEIQAAGIEEAKQIQYFSILFQPAENKFVWQNCAKAIVAKSDSELHEYILNMFEWLKDLNWPGFAIILERLKQFPYSTIGYWLSYSIKKAVKEKDALWLIGLACLCTDLKIYNQLNRKEKKIMRKSMKNINLRFENVSCLAIPALVNIYNVSIIIGIQHFKQFIYNMHILSFLCL